MPPHGCFVWRVVQLSTGSVWVSLQDGTWNFMENMMLLIYLSLDHGNYWQWWPSSLMAQLVLMCCKTSNKIRPYYLYGLVSEIKFRLPFVHNIFIDLLVSWISAFPFLSRSPIWTWKVLGLSKVFQTQCCYQLENTRMVEYIPAHGRFPWSGELFGQIIYMIRWSLIIYIQMILDKRW